MFFYSVLPQGGNWIPGMREVDWLEVKNLCQLESGEKRVKIVAAANTVSRPYCSGDVP